MWKVQTEKKADKELAKAPIEIQRKFEAWRGVAVASGVAGLVTINGYRDHPLKGEWQGFRSSSLTNSWRVIYHVEAETITILVVRVSNHDYR